MKYTWYIRSKLAKQLRYTITMMSLNKIRILEAVNQLGLGGTEYALQLYSKFLNKDIFEVTVVGLLNGGERVELIQNEGIEVILLEGDFNKLIPLLQNTDVVHWHGSGNCSGDADFFEILKLYKPPLVIQTNVFGAFDNSPYYDLIDYDLYISKMILIRRMSQDKNLKNQFTDKRKVLPYPVDTDLIHSLKPSEEQIDEFRRENRLDSYFVAGRIGRPDNNKFDLITLDAFSEFAKKVANTKFLLVGATAEMKAHADNLGITSKLLIIENTNDLKKLLLYYKAMDVFIAASNIGESFGMVIAEAMTLGTPVVTITTEDRDNAQIELVDNQVSGLVTKRNKKDIAAAVKYLYSNHSARDRISASSKVKIETHYKAQTVVKNLEHLILKHLNRSSASVEVRQIVLESFSKKMVTDYRRRCLNIFSRPSWIKSVLFLIKN